MSDIDNLSAASYAEGRDPYAVAEMWLSTLLLAYETQRGVVEEGRHPWPGWEDLSVKAVARRAIGRLLDAGWHPPTAEEVSAAAKLSKDRSVQVNAWLASLTPDQRHDVLDHYAHEGEFPPDCQPPPVALGEYLRGAS